MIVEFLVTSGRIFDFASLNFQVPMYGFAAKQPAAVTNIRIAVSEEFVALFMVPERSWR